MRTIKRALDPHNIMNPGKTVPFRKRRGAGPGTQGVTRGVHAVRGQQELLVMVAARLARRKARWRSVQRSSGGPGGREARTRAGNLSFSPSGLVPCLHDRETVVWDSLAIAEYLAERHPGMWPADRPHAPGRVRSRQKCTRVFPPAQRDDDVRARARRCQTLVAEDSRPTSCAIEALWNETRRRYGAGGGFLLRRIQHRRRVLRTGRVPVQNLWSGPRRGCRHLSSASARPPVDARMGSGRAGGDRGDRGRRAARHLPGQARLATPDAPTPSLNNGRTAFARLPRRARCCVFAVAAARASTAIRRKGRCSTPAPMPASSTISRRSWSWSRGPVRRWLKSKLAISQRPDAAFRTAPFGPGATLGGAVAAGLAGPRRPYAGAVRDLMLGVEVIDGKGD